MAPIAHESTAPATMALDPEIARILEFRRSLGLRHDVEYVAALQDDPRARVFLLDFPMTLAEERELMARQEETDRIVSVVQAYAAHHAGTFGGLYIDRDEMPGAVVAMFTDGLLAHELELRAKLGTAFVVLRQVRYSESFLRSLQDKVREDLDWLEDIPAAFQGLGVDTKRNVLTLEVSSAKPDAAARIAAHYGLGAAFEVISDGTGEALIPAGWIHGRVVTADGEVPPEPTNLRLDGELVQVGLGRCGGGDMGFGVGEDGTFRYPCQAGTRTVVILDESAAAGSEEVGRFTVEVPPDGVVEVVVTLDGSP
jgi:hypothetical protein